MVSTIDEVVAALDSIIDTARAEKNRVGYFAALYRRVTKRVRAGVAQGVFAQGLGMAHLDVVFANRYLDAYYRFRSGAHPGRAWAAAFNAAANPLPLVVQQLLAGINAHINYDLGIAAAEVNANETDFNGINTMLAAEVAGVERDLGEVSPLLGTLENIDLRTTTRIINFNLEKARNVAWASSQRLLGTPAALRGIAMDGMDLAAGVLGLAITHPPAAIALQLAPIRAAESNDVIRILDLLAADSSGQASEAAV